MKQWEIWKFPYPSADRPHWFVIVSPTAWCENANSPVVNGLLCTTLRPPGRGLKSHEVRVDPADDVEAHHGAESFHLATGQRMPRIARQPGIAHALDARVCGQELGDGLRVPALRLIAHEIGFHAALQEKRGVWIQCRPEDSHVSAHRVDELGATDHRAAHHVAMPGRVLRQAVREHIDVELAMVVETRQRVVEQGAGSFARRGKHADEIRQRLHDAAVEPERFGLVAERPVDRFFRGERVVRVDRKSVV
jgi:hypothetical protein